jgi:mono/diheme cytochrome c family protein
MPNALRQIRRTIPFCFVVFGWLLFFSVPSARAAAAPDGHGVAEREVSFGKDIKPLLEASCIQCHAKGKAKGGLSLETREAMLKGGDTGPAAAPGKGKDSLIVKLVSSTDPEEVMPKKGTKWTPDQIALLRAWIDKGCGGTTA